MEIIIKVILFPFQLLSLVINLVLNLIFMPLEWIVRRILNRPLPNARYMAVFIDHYEDFDFYGTREEWEKSCQGVSDEAVELFAMHWAHLEIANGGIWQFFFNSTGTIAPEAVKGFERIGLQQAAHQLQQAMDKFPNGYELDSEKRREIVEEIDPDGLLFENESDYFYNHVCNLEWLGPPQYFEAANAYYDARQHA
ncbi:DMP19 family protein [Pseudaestuariivita rosea]|uniref:DMP19 family protein n=1 Tax=Pseudaestuariivita rosea TaxID=2763263 RepID=UPI001ABAC6C6|nr:DUF4375 domain-containing protein [Pseudaestuariivita rosea]